MDILVKLLTVPSVILIFWLFGAVWGVRILGLLCLYSAYIFIKAGKISYGPRSGEPWGYLTGWSFRLIVLIYIILAAAMIVNPEAVLGWFGWRV
jgi:hypothetical protein